MSPIERGLSDIECEELIPGFNGMTDIERLRALSKIVDFVTDQQILIQREREYKAGYRDRKVGFYDKWYRRNGLEEGRYYDNGVMQAIRDGLDTDEFQLIECI